MKVSAIIVAAGKGERAKFNKNKLLAPLFGAPALWHTFEKFNIKEIDEVIVASSSEDFDEISALAAPFSYKVVLGGATRTQSVKCALECVSGEIVLIHDGARPFLSKELILKCIEETKKHKSAICAVKAIDTAVYLSDKITRPDRENLLLLQTPQAFFTKDIIRAYRLAGKEQFTDDSAVYEKFIARPHFIEGERQNTKLTYKSDFDRPPLPDCSGARVGFGVDTHAFGEGNFVILGGVKIPCDKRLIAHSDGDVLVHAVMDSLLSAAGLKDIGMFFPDTDEKYRGADSIKLLKEVVKVIGERGFAPKNVSISVQAEKPKLAKYIGNIRKNLSEALVLDIKDIAVAAGTCEGLGFVGKGLGITASCICSVKEVKHD